MKHACELLITDRNRINVVKKRNKEFIEINVHYDYFILTILTQRAYMGNGEKLQKKKTNKKTKDCAEARNAIWRRSDVILTFC